MTVKELIRRLGRYDENLTVEIVDADTGQPYEIDVDVDQDTVMLVFDPEAPL